jgi:hypothetical protein
MARVRRALSGFQVIMAAVLLTGLFPTTAAAQAIVAFTIKDPRIVSAPGLAGDMDAELYWTANRTGEQGLVYGITGTGTVRGTFNYRARPVDVQGLAVVGSTLYVGDIGDRNRSRSFVTVYLFDNPRPSGLTVTYRAYDFGFPDGPRNAETLLVSEAGRILFVTKDNSEGTIYAAPSSPSRSGTNRLTKVGNAPANVTDGVFLPGSEQFVLRTSTAVYLVDAASYRTLATVKLASQPPGNAVAVSLDGESLLLGSTGKNATVYSIPIPTASVTPTATPSPEPEEEESDTALSGRGTLLALGLAAVVAVVAGIVVGVIRDR